MIVLGIETSCDDAAIGIVENGKTILAHAVSSQGDFHAQYKGVYPEMAARLHVDTLLPTIEAALSAASLTPKSIDLIAVTKGPGLIGSLLAGLSAAKTLHLAWNTPFIGVNHVEAHLYAAMLSSKTEIFPSLGVVISGGHTFLVKIDAIGSYQLLGTTVDDAIGEAFDKVATLLGLPYPGGPHIEALAKKGNPNRFPFRAGRVKGRRLDFSFSGLKTNVLYTIKGQNLHLKEAVELTDQDKADVAASFQEVALSDIVEKTVLAADSFPCEAIYLGGGASQNLRLRELFQERSCQMPVYWPEPELCLDNGVMIAGLGFHVFKGVSDLLTLEAEPRLPIPSTVSSPL